MPFSIRRRGQVVVGVQSESAPTDTQWARLLSLCGEQNDRRVRVFIETYTSEGPNPRQRKDLLAMVRAHADIDCALITESLAIRGILTAMSWLGARVNAFNTDQYRQAVSYLGLNAEEVTRLLSDLDELRIEAGIDLSLRAARHATVLRGRESLRRRSASE